MKKIVTMMKTIDVIIPTYRPGRDFDRLLQMLAAQSVRPRSVIIMNSVENDGDILDIPDRIEDVEIRIFNIPKREFDHGHTRNLGVSHSTADYFVCMTQDAVPCNGDVIKILMDAVSCDPEEDGIAQTQACADKADAEINNGRSGTERIDGDRHGRAETSDGNGHSRAETSDGNGRSQAETSDGDRHSRAVAPGGYSTPGIAMAYARQLPREDASETEAAARNFNYPDCDRVKTREDIAELGIKTFFASNVCCCYDRKVFDELGGFVDRTDFNEDMMYGAKLIKAGYAIKYCAGAQVWHSHNYTARQQYERNKQIAISQAQHPEYFGGIRSESEGIRLVKNTAAGLVRSGKWYKIPELVYMSGAKYLGYRAGRRTHNS